jgi:hypothetical protein
MLRFLHFRTTKLNKIRPETYDRLWKITAFNKFNGSYANISVTEHLAVDEIIVLFKGGVIFRQYTQKEHKWFG